MFFIRIFIILHVVTVLAFPFNFRLGVKADGPSVVINEMLWMGSSTSSADEWLELRNVTDQPIDLSGWKLTKKSSGAEIDMLVLSAGANLAAQGYFLISNYPETHTSSALAAVPNVADSDVALANSALQIKLYNSTGGLVDIADDGSGNPLAGRYVSADQIYWSMERNPVPGDGSFPEKWHTASRGSGFKDGKTEYGTPGTANSNGLPVAVAGPDLSGVVGQAVNFDGSDSTDPEQQPLTFTWGFGDGPSGSGATPSHVYAAAGEFTVSLTVNDGVDVANDTLQVSISSAPAAAQTPTATNTNSPTGVGTPISSCRGLQLNEIFPNPPGVDDGEFIELLNSTGRSVPLAGCSIWLNEKRKYVLADGMVNAGQHLVIEKSISKLSLTNTGGSLRLADADGTTLETIDYPKAPENESWARFAKQWSWTNRVTPGARNLEPTDDESVESTSAKATGSQTAQAVSLADIQTLESGQLVKLQGVVTVPSDILGNRTIYFQDDTGAAQALLAEGATVPAAGDLIEVVGTVRAYQGRKRVSVKVGDIRVVASGRIIEPKAVTADQLSADFADQLVRMEGVVSSTSGAKIMVDDGSGEAEVYLKSSTGIIKPKISGGDRLAVTGVVNVATAGIKILPRTKDDLRVERVLGAATQVVSKPQILPTAPGHQTLWYWAMVGVGILAASVKPVMNAWKRKKAKTLSP